MDQAPLCDLGFEGRTGNSGPLSLKIPVMVIPSLRSALAR